MKRCLWVLLMTVPWVAFAEESVVHDDGTGAQISFYLPTHDKDKLEGVEIEYTTFRIFVKKDDKILLLADLVGKKTDDGKYFFGEIIIPSDFIASAEILLCGGIPHTSRGMHNTLKVSDFKKVLRKKCWTEQE
ncbi:MAG: hypothetical protein ABSE73_05155 [Planctomycetota bacterium]